MTGAKDLDLQIRDDVAVVRLTRPHKRNALSDGLIFALRDTFQNLPGTVRAAVLDGEGAHFCAGLDLSELKERDAGQGLHHSRSWHVALEALQYGPVPVVAALHGAVVGGGLELASACHVRVADSTTFYALPEGSRGAVVHTGIGAVAAVREGEPDVVILDLGLPGLDGIEVCRQIRTFSDCYILITTARKEAAK